MGFLQPWTASRNHTDQPAADTGRKEVVFIAADVADHRTLVNGMRTGLEVVLLDGADDGLSRMAGWARTHRGYHAVHVISHGTEGQLRLGSLTLDGAAAAARGADLATLGAALAEDGDLLLYGCEVAKGRGLDFIATLAAATGADVAASATITGSAALGGDWLLETRLGSVGTGIAITADAQRRYGFALATYTVSNTDDSGAGSLRDALSSATTSGDTVAFASGLSGTITLDSTLSVAAGVVFDASQAGGLTIAGSELTLAGALSIDNAGALTISSTLSGSGTLTKSGAGTLTLGSTSNSSSTMSLTVNDGTVAVDATGKMPTGAITLNGGDVTLGAGTYVNTIAVSSDATLTNAGAVTLSGAISGGSTLSKDGAGTLTLDSESNSGSATKLTIAAGKLSVATASKMPTGAITLSGGSLAFISGTFGNAITLSSDTTIDGSTGNVTLSGALGGSGALMKAGTGTLTLGGNSSGYTGAIMVSAGVLLANHANALGGTAAGTTVSSGATLRIGNGVSIAEPLTIAGLGSNSNGALQGPTGGTSSSAVAATATGAVTLSSGAAVNVGDYATLTLQGAISGNGNSLTKVSGGTLVLGGTNSYTGATTLSGGKLMVTGSLTSAVTASSGTTLGGSGDGTSTGLITGNVTVASGATLAPGVAGTNNGVGTLTIAGNLALNGTLAADLAGGGGVAGTDHDQLAVRGTVTLNSGSSAVAIKRVGGYSPTGSETYVLIDNDGGDAIGSTLAGIGQDAVTTGAGGAYAVSYGGGTGNDLSVTSRVAVTAVSSSTADSTYDADAPITITVTFDQAVTVTGTPILALNTGRTASYSGGSGGTTLTFLYTVQPGDNTADLDYASTTALSLNGGTITAGGDSTAAVLSLAAPGAAGSLGADKAIVIDTAPLLASAVVRGTTLTLTYNETLDGTSDPATTAYTVLVDGTATGVTAVDATGPTVVLTLASAVTGDQAVTVSYAVPGSSPVQDAAGNDAAALTGRAVTNRTPLDPSFTLAGSNILGLQTVGTGAVPVLADLDGDGDLDALVGDADGQIWFFSNNGTGTAPSFSLEGSNLFGLQNMGSVAAPVLADLDGDGDLDALVGDADGQTWFFRNGGTSLAPGFSMEGSNLFGLESATSNAKPTLADLDGDGDLDALIGDADGQTWFFRNNGTSLAPSFSMEGSNLFGLESATSNAKPILADLDGDGDLDALIGNDGGDTLFFRNNGTSLAPSFSMEGSNLFGLAALLSVAAPSMADLDGDGDLDALIGNGGGNLQVYRNGAIGIDVPAGLALAVASNSGSTSDLVTSDATPTITGSATAGDSVVLYDGATAVGTALAGGDGFWTITPASGLGDAVHTLTAAASLGWNSSGSSAALTITIDTSAPVAPLGLRLDSASDTGVKDGRYTGDYTPTIAGTAEARSTVTLYDGSGRVITSGTADGAGLWTITSSVLDDGDYSLTAKAVDAAGNTSAASSLLMVTIDTLAPVAPLGLLLDDASDTGARDGRYTTDTTPAITGTAEGNSTVTLYDGNGVTLLGTAVADGDGLWTITAGTLGSGDHSLTVTAMDRAGNTSAVSSTLTLTIDTTAPSMPGIPILAAGSDSGLKDGRYTSDGTPTISGTAEADSTVTLYDGDGTTALGTALADGSGLWTLTTGSLGSGDHSLTVKAVDLAGNTSGASTVLTITIDGSAPGMPDAPVLDPLSDSGPAEGRYTGDTTPTIAGTAEAYATITLYDGAIPAGTAVADGAGHWSLTTGSLVQGDHSLTVAAVDRAGNSSAASPTFTLTIDSDAPSVPGGLALDSGSDSGEMDGRHTNDDTPSITGTAEAHSILTLYGGDATTPLGTVATDGSGHWTITSGTLGEGDHSLTVRAVDRAGNSSAASSALAVTVDLTAPVAPGAPLLDQYSDSNIVGDQLTKDDTPEIKGTAEANSLVMLYGSDSSGLLGTAYADGSGHWSIVAGHLDDGSHSLTARSVDAAGNTSSLSSALTLTIDATAPTAPAALLLDPDSDGGSLDGRRTNDTTPTLAGTAEAQATVTLYDSDGATLLGTATADGDGRWSITAASLAQGDHSLTARAMDAAGNSSAVSSSLTVTIDTTAPQLVSAVANGGRLVLTYDGPLAAAFDPDGSDYVVKVGGSTATVIGVDAQGSTVTLLLDSPVTRSQAVTLGYTVPDLDPVQDDAGNEAAALSNRAVTNITPNYRTPTASPFHLPDVGDNAAPALADIDGDGDLDAFIGTKDGSTLVFRNIGGSDAPDFSLIGTNAFGLADIGDNATPVLADIDGDGDLDAVIGGADGNTRVFINTGTSASPSFSLLGTNSVGLADVGDSATPVLADIDGDGDLDAVIGGADGDTRVFINTGTSASPSFSLLGTNAFGLGNVGAQAAATLIDIDSDGDLDAFIGNASGNIVFFRNVGTSGAPSFSLSATNPYGLADVGDRAKPIFADLDADGDPDALIGNATGHALHVLNDTPLPPPPPPPTTSTTVDGVTVKTGTATNSDGSTSTVVTIPVITDTRSETVGGNTVADIPLVKDNGGGSLLSAQVPTGLGLTMTGSSTVKTAGNSLTDLVREIQGHTEAGSTDQTQLTGAGSGFLSGVPADTPLLVQTIVPTAPTGAAASTEPLVITGTPATPGNPYTALVIDTRGLPSGTVIQLQNVEFAAVIGAVRVTGGEGSQTVWGDGDAQYIVLGADDDTLHGGGGDDYVGSRTGNDDLFGDRGADTVTGGEDDDLVYGNQQDDVVYGNQGSDTLFGGQDQDTAFGGQGGDLAYGNRGADAVYGNRGDDRLFGGQGEDSLFGGQGDDVLFGNRGDDALTGGLGADLFAFQAGGGNDLITDFRFEDGDRLLAGGRSWTVSDGAAGAVVDFGSGDTVTLANIRADQLAAAWFRTS